MLQVIKLGENTEHDRHFMVDRPQGHPVYLLVLTQKDSYFYVEDKWQYIQKNTAFLFSPGQRHLYRAIETDRNEKAPAYIDSWAHIAPPLHFLPEHFPFGKPIFLHNPKDYFSLFHLIHNEFFGASPEKYKIIDCLMTALLTKLRNEADTKEYPPIYYDLISLRKDIYAFPFRKWKIPDMASRLNISSGYFHSCYKNFFGTTCIQDVIKSRTEYACDLLSSSHKSVEEIASLCGYQHTEHFIRQFKSFTGMTPFQWRNSIIK